MIAINACPNGDVQQSNATEIFACSGSILSVSCCRSLTQADSRRRTVSAEGMFGGLGADWALEIRRRKVAFSTRLNGSRLIVMNRRISLSHASYEKGSSVVSP